MVFYPPRTHARWSMGTVLLSWMSYLPVRVSKPNARAVERWIHTSISDTDGRRTTSFTPLKRCMQPSHLLHVGLRKKPRRKHTWMAETRTRAHPRDRIDTHARPELKTSTASQLARRCAPTRKRSACACMHACEHRPTQDDPGRACTYVNDGYHFSWTTPSFESFCASVPKCSSLTVTTRMYCTFARKARTCPCNARLGKEIQQVPIHFRDYT